MPKTTPGSPAPVSRYLPLVILDIAVGIIIGAVTAFLTVVIAIVVIDFNRLQTQCTSGPYTGIVCDEGARAFIIGAIVVLMTLAWILGIYFFLRFASRARWSFYWPLVGFILVVIVFYIGTAIMPLTIPSLS